MDAVFSRSTRSEEVQIGPLAKALQGAATDYPSAGSSGDAGEPPRARRLTGGRRLLPPRSASVEGELPLAADGAGGPRGDGGGPMSPTRRQGGLRRTMKGHLTLGEVRLRYPEETKTEGVTCNAACFCRGLNTLSALHLRAR